MPKEAENKEKHKKYTATVGQVLGRYWTASMRRKKAALAILFIAALGYTLDLIPAIFYKQFFDTLTISSPSAETAVQLTYIIIAVLWIKIATWIAFRTATFIQVHFQSGVMSDLRDDAFKYLMDHSYGFFSDNFAGSLVQRINRYANSFDRIGDRVVWDFLPLGISMIGVILGIWYFSPVMALVIVIGSGTLMFLQGTASYFKIKYDVDKSEKDSQVTGALADAITNHTTIQSFAGRFVEFGIFGAVNRAWCRSARITWTIDNAIEGVQAGVIITVEFFLFYYGIRYWQNGDITIGTFVFAQSYFNKVIHYMWSFGRAIRDCYHSVADAQEMVGIMNKVHEIMDAPHAGPLHVSAGHIEFNHVDFIYHADRHVLDDVSLDIPAGQRVALVGPSGAGKSTLVKLIFRFHDINSGEILIDGQNIKKVAQDSLRKNVSLVPQDPILFHRSLMENIRYGRQDATDEQVYYAAKLAHCHEFIDNLPKKYETFVGERGIKLSGGERQRVAIARAILKNAPILVLDEATSSLDSHSEMLIQDALDTLMKGRTTIVIAHRLSTIRKMDRIIVMDNGKITEDGTHESLNRKRNGLYKKLWKLQAGGFIPSKVSDNGEEKDEDEQDDL